MGAGVVGDFFLFSLPWTVHAVGAYEYPLSGEGVESAVRILVCGGHGVFFHVTSKEFISLYFAVLTSGDGKSGVVLLLI